MNKYQNGKIYKITSKQTDDVYIGSTIQKLSHRMSGHKSRDNTNSYLSRCITKYADATIELIEDYPCETHNELLWRERYYFENTKCVNKKLPILSTLEQAEYSLKYRLSHKERKKEIGAEYYEKNKKEILEKQKIYCENTKGKRKKQTKIYRENNKEELLEKQRIRYENNKEKILGDQKIAYEKNKKEILERQKIYKQKNKEYYKTYDKFKRSEFGKLCQMF